MYITKAKLRPGAARSEAYWDLAQNGYRAHRLVWSLFGDTSERDRDFVYRWDTESSLPQLYVVSERAPDDHEDLFRLHTKPYDPVLKRGQPLRFSLRANTVVKKTDEDGHQKAHDVVMNAKWEMRQEGVWESCDLTHAELVQREGRKWLAKRTDQYGFRLPGTQVQAEAHRKHSFEKPQNGRQVTFVTMDLSGLLRVDDPATFRESLFNGVGPTKAYGCGLLLVRPPR
jgi:CRISPR system Cascade subunit CasE